MKDDIDSLIYIFQIKLNKTFINKTFFLKTDSCISSYQENDIYMKSESISMIRRKSEIETNSNYSPLEFLFIIARNISISKKYSLFYIFSFFDMNNDYIKNSFYIIIISI